MNRVQSNFLKSYNIQISPIASKMYYTPGLLQQKIQTLHNIWFFFSPLRAPFTPLFMHQFTWETRFSYPTVSYNLDFAYHLTYFFIPYISWKV